MAQDRVEIQKDAKENATETREASIAIILSKFQNLNSKR